MSGLEVKECDPTAIYSMIESMMRNVSGRIVWFDMLSFIAEVGNAYHYCYVRPESGDCTLVILPKSLVDAEVRIEDSAIEIRVKDEALVGLERAALETLDAGRFSMLSGIDLPQLSHKVRQTTLRDLGAYVAVRAAAARLKALAEIVVGATR